LPGDTCMGSRCVGRIEQARNRLPPDRHVWRDDEQPYDNDPERVWITLCCLKWFANVSNNVAAAAV